MCGERHVSEGVRRSKEKKIYNPNPHYGGYMLFGRCVCGVTRGRVLGCGGEADITQKSSRIDATTKLPFSTLKLRTTQTAQPPTKKSTRRSECLVIDFESN